MSDELHLSDAHTITVSQGVHRLVILATDGRELLTVDLAAGTVSGELEDAGEAAAAFVRYVRIALGLPQPSTEQPDTAAIRARYDDVDGYIAIPFKTLRALCDALDAVRANLVFHVDQEARAILEHMETRNRAEARIEFHQRQSEQDQDRRRAAEARIAVALAILSDTDRPQSGRIIEARRALTGSTE